MTLFQLKRGALLKQGNSLFWMRDEKASVLEVKKG